MANEPLCQAAVRRFRSTQSTPRVVIPPMSRTRGKALSAWCVSHNFDRNEKGLRSPAGPRRLRDSDAHKRIAAPQALFVLREHTRPRPKSGKVCRSDTRAGDVCERAERSEGSDTTPIRNAPCFAVCALVCDLSRRAECVLDFRCESEREPFASEVEKRDEERLGIKFVAAVSPDFSHLLVLRVHREPGNVE